MRDQWYSDNRDLIKWSVLFLLAREVKADRIVQIAFLNRSEFGDIEFAGTSCPAEVLAHFRDLGKVTALTQRPRISVFDHLLSDRTEYVDGALNFVSAFRHERTVLFLDPDTGLEPRGGGDSKHVLKSELRRFWDVLMIGSTLVFYQHETNKAGMPWIEEKQTQFAEAIGKRVDQVRVASGSKIARDVVFFLASKT